MLNRDTLAAFLGMIADPVEPGSIMDAKRVSGLVAREDGTVGLILEVGDMARDVANRLERELKGKIGAQGAKAVRIIQTAERTMPKPVPNVKHVLAVGAGKGGVGKSTVAVNLARAFLRRKLKVGVLDGDIRCPSVHLLLGMKERAKATPDKKLLPLLSPEGIEMLGMGVMADPEKALAWRGPMVSGAVTRMATSCLWNNLDVLVVDLPPGTGDIHLALAQKLAPSGAIIVTTPQTLAMADAQRAAWFYRRLEVPFFGYVSNMEGPIFGEIDEERLGAPLLARLPLEHEVVVASDERRTPGGANLKGMDEVAETLVGLLKL